MVVVCLLFPSQVFAAEVILGGQSIGIELDYDGVMISGTYEISIDNKKYNPANDGYLSGDLIVAVNGEHFDSISLLMDRVEKEIEDKQTITLTIKRHQKEVKKELKFQENNGQFTTGLYVQDGLTGIGTMTYYNPQTRHFGALGHLMCDVSLSSDVIIKEGSIYNSYVKYQIRF